MIKNLIFRVYLIISDFFGRKSQSQQTLPKKITPFVVQFRSRNLTDSLNIIKNILPQQS